MEKTTTGWNIGSNKHSKFTFFCVAVEASENWRHRDAESLEWTAFAGSEDASWPLWLSWQ